MNDEPQDHPTDPGELAARIEEAAKQSGPALETPRSKYVVVRLFDHLVEFLGAAMMLAITGILFANAVGRYAFRSPVIWSDEVATSMIIWVAVVGMLISLRRGELLTVAVLTNKLTPNQRRYMQALSSLLSAAAFGYLAWLGWTYLEAFGGDLTPYLRWPKGLFSSAIPIGIGLMTIGFVVQAVNVFRGRASLDGSELTGSADRGDGGPQ